MSGLDLNFQSLWLPHFSCLKVRHVRPVGTDQIPVYMGNQVHTLFTPEPNPRYCDDIMGPERSTQRSKTKECKHIDIRATSSICSRRGDGVSAAVCGGLVRSVGHSWRLLRCDCEGKNSCAGVVFCCGRIQRKWNVFLFTMIGDKRRLISYKNAPKPDVSLNTSCFSICKHLLPT